MDIYESPVSDTDKKVDHEEIEVVLLNLEVGDIVRFLLVENDEVFTGEVTDITKSSGQVSSITVMHLDQKHKNMEYQYFGP